MSGKFAKVQKRRRWCDHGLQVPDAYKQLLVDSSCEAQQGPSQVATSDTGLHSHIPGQPDKLLAQQLLRFVSIQFTYGEVEELKTSIAAAELLAAKTPATCPSWPASMRLLLELLFLENSRPLHKQILALVRKLSAAHQQVIGQLLSQRIQQEAESVLGDRFDMNQPGGAATAEQQQSPCSCLAAKAASAVAALQQQEPLTPAAAQQGLTLAQAAVSLLWLSTARDWMTSCSPVLLLAVARSVHSTLGPAGQGKHLTPNTMELVQDAISVLYYTLQHQGQHLAGPAGVLGAAAITAAADCMLQSLQGTALVREAMASAAVVVWSAAVLPHVPPAAAAAAFAAGLTPQHLQAEASSSGAASECAGSLCRSGLQHAWEKSSLLEQWLLACGTSLVAELQRTSAAGRICALKGLLTAMPAGALAGDISAWQQQQQQQDETGSSSGSSNSGVSFIMHCVLPFATAAARSSPDAHYKFHAVSVVAVALQRAKQLWQELVQQEAAAAATVAEASQQQQQHLQCNGTAQEGEQTGSQPVQSNMVVPWLTGTCLSDAVSLLWGNLDEPMSQTLAKIQDAWEALLALVVYQDTAAKQINLTGTGDNTAGDSSSSSGSSSTVHCDSKGSRSSSSSGAGCGSGSVPGFGSWHDTGSFLHTAACAVLSVPAGRKGRYSPLSSLLQWVGASYLLQLQPQLVQQVLGAMQDDMVANTATSFFRVLLLQLRRQESSAEVPAAAAAAVAESLQAPQQLQQSSASDEQLLACISDAKLKSWCRWWLPCLLRVLWGPDERFRTYLTNRALPVVLQAEPSLLPPIVGSIMAAHAAAAAGPAAAAGVQQHVPNTTAALVVVLKAARKMQLVGDLDTLLPPPPQQQQQQHTDCDQAAGTGSSSSRGTVLSPAALLLSAVSSSSSALRIETLELACVNARSTEPPGELELALARRWLLLCLRCTGAGARSKSLVMWEKLLSRQRAAVAAIRHRAAAAKKPGATGGAHPRGLPKPAPNYLAVPGAAAAVSEAAVLQRQYNFIQWLSQTLMDSLYPGGPYERKYYALQLLAILLAQWKPTSADVYGGSSSSSNSGMGYPAVLPLCAGLLAPAAVQVLLGCLIDTWDKLRMAAAAVLELLPTPLPGLGTAQQLQPLLTWALQLTQSPRVRESDAGARLMRVLLVKYLLELRWTFQLYPTPCVQDPAAAAAAAAADGDCGGLSSGSSSSSGGHNDSRNNLVAEADDTATAVVDFLSSLTGQLRSQLSLARSDMAAASRRGFVHGSVLTLRYAVDELPWAKLTNSSCSVCATVGVAAAAAAGSNGSLQQQQQQQFTDGSSSSTVAADAAAAAAAGVTCVSGAPSAVLQVWMADLLVLLAEAAHMAQPYLSTQDLNMAADEVEEDDESDDDAELPGEEELQPEPAPTDLEVQPGSTATLSGPAIQLLITACWTSVKEISLLIGTLTRRLPLPGGSGGSGIAAAAAAAANDDSSSSQATPVAAAPAHATSSSNRSADLMQPHQLAEMGDLLLSLLLAMKHNGAVEKSQPGFLWLSEQLLQSPKPTLNSLPGVWLEQCLARVQAAAQCRDDIVRRSAGLPFAISCLFLSEPHGVPRQLLPHGLEQLLEVATDETLQEPWPRVHAFNCLRCIFNDAAMALDTSGFHAAGVAAAIQGMAAAAWEVRNAAALTFTALVTRVIGYKNAGNKEHLMKPLQQLAASPATLNLSLDAGEGGAQPLVTAAAAGSGSSSSMYNAPKASWCVKSPTASDFFYRYPQLHGFFLEQLQEAAQLLGQAGSSSSSKVGQGSEVPPSLFPVLVILSRLKPSLLLNSSIGSGSSSSTVAAAGDAGDAPAAAAVDLSLSPVAFIPAVLAVGRSSMMGVRQIAAASLAPLVAADQLHTTCLALADQLPRKPWTKRPTSAAAADCSCTKSAQAGVSHNALHGTLLQLTALLRAVAGSSSSSSSSGGNSSVQVAGLVAALLPAFASTSWLASSRTCSSAVRQAYIAAAGQLVILAYINWSVLLQASGSSSNRSSDATAAARVAELIEQLRVLVSDLHASCLAAVQSTVPPQPAADGNATAAAAAATGFAEARDPQHCCLLRDCTALLLGHLLRMQLLLQQYHQQQHEQQQDDPSWPLGSVAAGGYVKVLLQQLQQLLLTCLSSGSYEVRASALKAAAVQLHHVLQLSPQLLMKSGSTAGEGAAAGVSDSVQKLQQQLWAALEGEKTIKVLKRLVVVLGQLQELQQTVQQQQQQRTPPALAAAAAEADDGAVLQQLRAALSLAKQYKQLDIRTASLKCAAREVRPAITAVCSAAAAADGHGMPDGSSSSSGVFGPQSKQYLQHMQQLLQLLQVCSLPSQQEEMREAAAEALQLSGVLHPLAARACSAGSTGGSTGGSTQGSAVVAVARLSLSAWSVAVRLMEDEEDMVRQPAADAALQVLQAVPAVQLAVHSKDGAAASWQCLQAGNIADCAAVAASSSSAGGVAGSTAGSTGQYVEAVEQHTFDLLARCGSWWPELLPNVLQLLSNVIFEPGTAVPEVLLQQCRKHERAAAEANSPRTAAAAAAATSDGSSPGAATPAAAVLAGILVRRLFEKEADNHHEEQVLLAQHAAAALYQALLLLQQRTAGDKLIPAADAAAARQLLSGWCQGLCGFLRDSLGSMSAVSSSTAGGWIGGDTNHPEVFVPLYRCLLGLLASAPCWTITDSEQQQQQGGDKSGTATTPVKAAVQGMVTRLLQLQPTALLLPVLRGLQELCADDSAELNGRAAGGSRVLFLVQRD